MGAVCGQSANLAVGLLKCGELFKTPGRLLSITHPQYPENLLCPDKCLTIDPALVCPIDGGTVYKIRIEGLLG